ncbi:MAG TPA: kinase [Novosphingobium sp.]|nr:kinase [Novosphingobium sp.]
MAAVTEARRRSPGRRLVLGIAGSQGSGKSMIAENLVARFPQAASLSLDDLYLTRDERDRLAGEVHPLLATRGVPGTHDVALGLHTLDAFRAGQPALLPRFDKGRDERMPQEQWPMLPEGCDLLVFEGWCLGATPQDPVDLEEPVNERELGEDQGGVWRRYVNAQLAGPYQALFEPIDVLVFLAAPSFETVMAWRSEQEQGLRAARPDAPHLMDADQIRRFIALYERLTRHMLRTMPDQADVVIALNENRQCPEVTRRT